MARCDAGGARAGIYFIAVARGLSGVAGAAAATGRAYEGRSRQSRLRRQGRGRLAARLLGHSMCGTNAGQKELVRTHSSIGGDPATGSAGRRWCRLRGAIGLPGLVRTHAASRRQLVRAHPSGGLETLGGWVGCIGGLFRIRHDATLRVVGKWLDTARRGSWNRLDRKLRIETECVGIRGRSQLTVAQAPQCRNVCVSPVSGLISLNIPAGVRSVIGAR